MHAQRLGLEGARGEDARATAWPWLVVEVLDELSREHPELRLEDLARRARAAAGAEDRARVLQLARQAARETLGVLARREPRRRLSLPARG
jgi:hypothetical protein